MSDTPITEGDIEEPSDSLIALSDVVEYFRGLERTRSASSMTFDQIRNRVIYELNKETVTDAIDDQDDTLPYLENIGSKLDVITAVANAAISAINEILNDKENWETQSDSQSTS